MNKLHFMSVLGVNKYGYSYCTYKWRDSVSSPANEDNPDHSDPLARGYMYTRYVQLASLSRILEEHKGDIRITIFLTDEARESSWEGHFTLKEGSRDATEENRGLKHALEDFRDKIAQYHPDRTITIDGVDEGDVDAVRIPSGKNQAEQDEIFRTMYDSIEPGETVFFDLTHGFRTIPILAITVLNYARAVKNIKVQGLYYGAFDAPDENDMRPVFDMTYCDSVMQWTAAAESFITSGSSNQIGKVYRDQAQITRQSPAVRETVNSLYDLTNCLETSRGRKKPAGGKAASSLSSIDAAYERFYESYDQMDHRNPSIENYALHELFGIIKKETDDIFGIRVLADDGTEMQETSVGIAAVAWAIRKGLTQQGLTALESTLTTFVGECCGFTAELTTLEGRELIYAALYNKPAKGYKKDDPNKYSEREKRRKEMTNAVEKRLKSDTCKRLESCIRWTKDARNSINHFGLMDEEPKSKAGKSKGSKKSGPVRNLHEVYTYEDLNDALRRYFADFMNCIAVEFKLVDNNDNVINVDDWVESFTETDNPVDDFEI